MRIHFEYCEGVSIIASVYNSRVTRTIKIIEIVAFVFASISVEQILGPSQSPPGSIPEARAHPFRINQSAYDVDVDVDEGEMLT